MLRLNPTVVTLFFGMNDGGYQPVNPAATKAYRDGMEGIIKALQAKNIRVIVFSPGCVDYDKRKNLADADYNKNLAALAQAAKELAERYACDYIDVLHPMMAFQAGMKATDPAWTMIPDAVHPDQKGHLMMARTMLPALAEPMPPVGAVDVAAGTASEGVTLTGRSDAEITLKISGRAPVAIEPGSIDVARACGYTDFALPKLSVMGLNEGAYEVSADGQFIMVATAEELAAGVPLAARLPDAKRLLQLTTAKENNYFTAWREVFLIDTDDADVQKIVEGMMNVDELLYDHLRALSTRRHEMTVKLTRRPQGKNLAWKKNYVSSDPNRSGWNPGLTDGSWNAAQRMTFATGTGPFPKTVTVDLEKPQTIASVVVGVPPFGSTKTVGVSVSKDNAHFTEVGTYDFEQGVESRHTYVFEPTTARYVRLTYLAQHARTVQYPPSHAFTTELEVYSTNAAK